MMPGIAGGTTCRMTDRVLCAIMSDPGRVAGYSLPGIIICGLRRHPSNETFYMWEGEGVM